MLTEKEVQEKLNILIYKDVIGSDELREFAAQLNEKRDGEILKELNQLFYDTSEEFVLIDSTYIEDYYQITFEGCVDTSNIPKEHQWMLKHIDWESVVRDDFSNGVICKHEFFNREWYVEVL